MDQKRLVNADFWLSVNDNFNFSQDELSFEEKVWQIPNDCKIVLFSASDSFNQKMANLETIQLGENSSLHIYQIHQTKITQNIQIIQQDYSQFKTVQIVNTDFQNTIKAHIVGKNCQTDLFFLTYLKAWQNCLLDVSCIHTNTNSCSKQIVKSVLDGQSSIHFHGLIDIKRIAVQTNASQRHSTLVLSKDTSTITKPDLQIATSEVQCKHAVAIGFPSQEEIFYLQSRGLSEKNIQQMLVKSFAQEILEQIEVICVRDKIFQKLS